jgi:hypothetical protein
MINEHEEIVLADDLPEYGLKRGDIGTVVYIHQGGKGYEVEFITLDGETLAVASVTASQVRRIKKNEIAQARNVELPLAA